MTATMPGPPPSVDAIDASNYLKAYVPRLVIDWLRNTPDAMHREVEATLVFVDISGFTALTERLARKGKVGAEIMRDTLDGVFTALLDEAYDWGAGLLKWGGDALLLMFEGPQHPERAVRAAWEMQRTIDRVGRIHQGGGTVILRMSVGIGTGTFHFFMAGSVHRELLIAGPAMSETLVMEGIADAGEIGLMPGLAAMLDPAIIGGPKLTTILLAGPPDVERGRAPDVGDVSNLDIPGCIPVAARAHVLLHKSEAEHRTITAAFIDLMDTDRLLDEVGPDALAAGLDERIRAIEEAALRYEVPFYETDVGKSSVKALLTAGAPSSTGHDEERMLRTLREVMDQPGLVPMRVGVNTGKVFTGDFGPRYRRAYRVFGDAINTAARVMAKADAGQILSTEIVLDRSRTFFETTPIEPFAAKGKAALVHASVVGPVIGMKESNRDDIGLIGRESELQALLGVVDAARGGHGGVIEIAGEPGLGKSRLVEELIARSEDFRILRSRCEEYEASTPYFAFRSLVRSVLGVDADTESEACIARLRDHVRSLDPELLPWTPLIGILLGLDMPDTPETAALEEQFIRDRLAEVALRFFYQSLEGDPTLFVIEDVQHLDEASRDLLQRLSTVTSEVGQVLLVTRQGSGAVFRSEDDEAAAVTVTTIELGPLSFDATIAIIEAATEDAPLRPHDVEEVARRSGGNTLFLFQLIDAVRETGTTDALPDSIEALVAADVDRLAPTDRTILRYAAVLGSAFDQDLLAAAVAGDVELDDGVWHRLDSLLGRYSGGELRFKNTLIRDAAYEGLPYRRRRALHNRVGEAIEARAGDSLDDEMGVLAIHYFEGQSWDKAWRFATEAGDRALSLYANAEATRFYERALEAGRRRRVPRPELAGVHERSSDARYRLGEFEAADRDLQAAKRLAGGSAAAVGAIMLKQAVLSMRSGHFQQALVRIARALRRLENARGKEAGAIRARIMVARAGVRFFQNQRAKSIRWARLAEREAKRSGARDALAQAYKTLDLAFKESGQLDRAIYSSKALEIYEELGDLRNQALTLNNMGTLAQERSDWDEARELYERSLMLFERMGDRTTAGLAKFNIAQILSDQGRFDEAEPLFREVLRVWRAAGADADVAEARRELGKIMARTDRLESASELLDEARAEQLAAGQQGEALSTDVRRAEVRLFAGRADAALALIDEACDVARTTDGGTVFLPILERLRSWALIQTGQGDAATTLLDRLLSEAKRRGDDFEQALTLDALIVARSAIGDVTVDLLRERSQLTKKLGIVRIPSFPTASVSAPVEPGVVA
jgi:class 3 adenylate cyclase/tetratricopeptide (TPR) repeat protein